MTDNILARSGKLYMIEMPEKLKRLEYHSEEWYQYYCVSCNFANPDQEWQKDINALVDLAIAEALESGEFEDHRKVKDLLWATTQVKGIYHDSIPDGTYHVYLPRTEKVIQFRAKSTDERTWIDVPLKVLEHHESIEYRTIVRFIK